MYLFALKLWYLYSFNKACLCCSEHSSIRNWISSSFWALLCQPVREPKRIYWPAWSIRGAQLRQGKSVQLEEAVVSEKWYFTWVTTSTWFIFCFVPLQGEGVAYRGRVLVELSTQLDEKVDKNLDEISSDDILVAQVQIFVLFILWIQKRCFELRTK